MKLYNAWYCPYAQRVWMALIHKGIDFEYIEVDPYDATDWWKKVSRGAELVPVLVAGDAERGGEITVVESLRILEFLDDLRPRPAPIFAADPFERAEQKYWMDQVGSLVTPHLYGFLKADEAGARRDESRQNLVDGVARMARAMDGSGPFFSGAAVDAVDIALIPFACRIDVLLEAYRDFELPAEGDPWRRYHDWYRAMLAQPAFRATAFDNEGYQQRLVEHYLPYSRGGGQSGPGGADRD